MPIALITALALSTSAQAGGPQSDTTATLPAPQPRTQIIESTLHGDNLGARYLRRINDQGTLVVGAAGGGGEGAASARVEFGVDTAIGGVSQSELSIGSRIAYDVTTAGGTRASAVTLAAPLVLRTTGKRGLTFSVAFGPSVAWQLDGRRSDMRAHTQLLLVEESEADAFGSRIGMSTELTLGYRF
jgi:hypothetical protein